MSESFRNDSDSDRIPEFFINSSLIECINPKKEMISPILSINKQLKPPILSKNPIENSIRLEMINPRILENPDTGRRIDEFIISQFNNITQIPSPAPIRIIEQSSEVIVAAIGQLDHFFSSSGLSASVRRGEGFFRQLTIGGVEVDFSGGYTQIDFLPKGRDSLDRAQMTKSLAAGIQGIIELLEAIDSGRFAPPITFLGITNINMALIAQRLGFIIVDQSRTPDGNIDKHKKSFTVVGYLDDIRDRINEFKAAGTIDRLQQRITRPVKVRAVR